MSDNSDLLREVETVLDERVRPSLHAHGGDVVVKDEHDGVLRVRLVGGCAGCPAAHDTNEELIKAAITEVIPAISDVVLVEEVSPELLDFARRILRHEAGPGA